MSDLMHIEGGAELFKALGELPVKIERRVLRGALRAGAKVIEEEAKRRVPVKTGALRDSIRVSTSARGGQVTATIKAGGKKGGQVYYAHLVEYGSAPHVILPGGGTKAGKVLASAARILGEKVDHPGSAPHQFMRPALDTQAQAALDAMADYARTRIEKEAAK